MTVVPIHFHAMAELTLVHAGEGSIRIAGRQYPVEAGLLAFAPPNVLHGQFGEQPVAKTVCMFDMALVEPALAGDPVRGHLNTIGTTLPAVVRLDPAEAAGVRQLFDAIVNEGDRQAPMGGGVMAAALIVQVLVTFLRRTTTGADDGSAGDGRAGDLGEPDDELNRVLSYVQEHYTKPINRATVARALGMRPESVSRVFTQSGGENFSAFLRHLRVGHALELLQGTTLSASDIGRMSGFDSYRTFARAFTTTFAMSPSAYRDEFGRG